MLSVLPVNTNSSQKPRNYVKFVGSKSTKVFFKNILLIASYLRKLLIVRRNSWKNKKLLRKMQRNVNIALKLFPLI